MPMNKELKDRWITDLERPELQDKQAVGYLHKEGSDGIERFCCLGRLCVVAGLTSLRRGDFFEYDGQHGVLPQSFRKEIGLSIEHQATMYRLNDEERLTFAQIAQKLKEDPTI